MNERDIDNELRNRITKTEDEIADFCFDKEGDDDDDSSDRSHEDLTGWDGRPLSLLEHAASNPSTHVDRPYELAYEQGHAAELTSRDDQLIKLQFENEYLRSLADPERQARDAQVRDDMLSRIVSDPDAALHEIDRLQYQSQQAISGKVEVTMADAHDRYGADFEDAYRDLTSCDKNDPAARALVQRIMHSDHPGEALMKWHHGRDAGRSSGPFWNPGGRGRSSGGGRSARSSRDDGGGSNGDGNRDTERGIADSVWDDVTSGGSRGHRSRGGSEDDDIVDYAFG